jgi:hypothetical protein
MTWAPSHTYLIAEIRRNKDGPRNTQTWWVSRKGLPTNRSWVTTNLCNHIKELQKYLDFYHFLDSSGCLETSRDVPIDGLKMEAQ